MMFGEDINLKVSAIGGHPPYTWTYLRLPYELSGDKKGFISGSFNIEGSYSFGVNVADISGQSEDIFITLNIQPMTFFGKYMI